MPEVAIHRSLRRLTTGLAAALGLLMVAPVSPTAADTYANGLSFDVLKVAPYVQPGTGAVTLTVTNSQDSYGHSQNFTVFSTIGTHESHTVTVPDGATSNPITFSTGPGTQTFCAQGDASMPISPTQSTTPHGCIDVVVPDGTSEAYNGDVTFDHTCQGLRYTVTNTSDRDAVFYVFTKSAGFKSFAEQWTLKPGDSRTGQMGRLFEATVSVDIGVPEGGWSEHLATATWQPPETECPLVGGTSFVKWGRVRDRPAIVVRHVAMCPSIGFQYEGQKRIKWGAVTRGKVDEDRCPVPGRHRHLDFSVYLKKPGQAVRGRVWVKYVDASTLSSNARGITRLTGWHTFRRS